MHRIDTCLILFCLVLTGLCRPSPYEALQHHSALARSLVEVRQAGDVDAASDLIKALEDISPLLAFGATPSSSSSAAGPTPSAAYTLLSSAEGTPIHFQPWNAAGFRFYIGNETSSYCPTNVTNCPSGNATAFMGLCGMDVEVPGGQQIYVTPSGEIGYTQAHSVSVPNGANLCPFYYNKQSGADVGQVTLIPATAFSAGGFMACPTDSGDYQIFASFPDAVVPQGDVAQCIVFEALAGDYDAGGYAAWQYT